MPDFAEFTLFHGGYGAGDFLLEFDPFLFKPVAGLIPHYEHSNS